MSSFGGTHARGNEQHLIILCNLVAYLLDCKGNEQHIPPQTDTVVRFAPEHVARFLHRLILRPHGKNSSTGRGAENGLSIF